MRLGTVIQVFIAAAVCAVLYLQLSVISKYSKHMATHSRHDDDPRQPDQLEPQSLPNTASMFDDIDAAIRRLDASIAALDDGPQTVTPPQQQRPPQQSGPQQQKPPQQQRPATPVGAAGTEKPPNRVPISKRNPFGEEPDNGPADKGQPPAPQQPQPQPQKQPQEQQQQQPQPAVPAKQQVAVWPPAAWKNLPPVSPTTHPMTAFVRSGGVFPILLMACNRPELLRQTIDSLLTVRHVKKDLIFVAQDGNMQAVTDIIAEYGLHSRQRPKAAGLRGGVPMDGAERIATHYGFSLKLMFDEISTAPGVIIVEDDFSFAPDFVEYFLAIAPALVREAMRTARVSLFTSAAQEADPTLFVASAWNDNGFDTHVRNPNAVKRTGFFPGLGWLLPRTLYERELKLTWPNAHWDHWLRSPEQHRNRDCLYPEVSRTFHMGVKGTFMDRSTHDKYFAAIALQKDRSFSWSTPDAQSAVAAVNKESYFQRLRQAIQTAIPVVSVQQLLTITSGTAVLWHDTEGTAFQPIAAYFHIWHELHRGTASS